ncbi:hypothetical protein CDAR_76701 [Caerostris darwini]|uniref:Uncharacterized protein n=1 Tax=Caerostris darwini TaxID=1538125 RepID=A0AAV4QFH0_9ARAC|nr:hypothetical protein CDAR_76701 [Caerostris darwini]
MPRITPSPLQEKERKGELSKQDIHLYDRPFFFFTPRGCALSPSHVLAAGSISDCGRKLTGEKKKEGEKFQVSGLVCARGQREGGQAECSQLEINAQAACSADHAREHAIPFPVFCASCAPLYS